jgi:regulator of sigma E protease
MTTVVAFIVVIGILILIHEWGHFIVARWAGVGVERFSIGFGPVLLRWRGKETEYCLSIIPMGGYVKMMGEENPLEGGQALTYDPAKAFSLKPLWKRFLIVFAGPGMNFVLAAVIFMVVLATVGRPVWPPVIGRVAPDGPAAAAGLQTGDAIVSADGRLIAHWEDLDRAVASSSAGRPLRLTVARAGVTREVTVMPRLVEARDPIFKEAHQTWEIGVGPQLLPQIGSVNAGSPAEKAGLKSGDVVVAVAGQPVFTPEELMQAIQKRAGQTFEMTVERNGPRIPLTVTANAVKERNAAGEEVEVGRIGVGIVTRTVNYEPYPPHKAVWYGVVKTWDMTALTAKGLWKIVSRQIDSSNIGGPIQIASEAGRQAKEGPASLALFTAIISVNLALLNLLPVPMLDGGHLFFFVIEAIMGRPLSLRKREAAQQLGFVLLMLLMVYALYNDLVRIDAFRFFR